MGGMVPPEMKKIELGISCVRTEMMGYEFLHHFLTRFSPLKINPL